ncbi:Hypothetical predicted protein [Marmota monax]|uniref:Uncharacterized protein n=1 Tax=Marmota monax TaxID=9995 RepID=A0A5E4B7J0_MARMO|nr:hypothetical protein GHT09_006973 [Marmota monax]VTJ65668.1 Hypothetical predicted protein [Marmota monax]
MRRVAPSLRSGHSELVKRVLRNSGEAGSGLTQNRAQGREEEYEHRECANVFANTRSGAHSRPRVCTAPAYRPARLRSSPAIIPES